MKTIKAARVHRYGGADTIQLEEASLADPQSGQLLVRVNAAGVNPIDSKIRAGYLQEMLPLTLAATFPGSWSWSGPASQTSKPATRSTGKLLS
jgi:NADPH:quinone reductase-like Zn-dependent oxidoreductase